MQQMETFEHGGQDPIQLVAEELAEEASLCASTISTSPISPMR